MKSFLSFLLLSFLFPAFLQAQKIIRLTVDGSINPAVSDYIKRGIEKATNEEAEILLIKLNTPGGLLKSTRVIVGDILESPVPVVVYVSPNGAHAGSAGVFITMAAHVAVMALNTNIGAAHPVSMQGGMDSVMNDKTTNDAAAFIRSIAESRNRNLDWAEEAVRKSVSITAAEALDKNVIDYVSASVQALLIQLDGKTINLPSGTKTLRTEMATEVQVDMSFIENLLNLISDPNFAYILMMLGFYGILFELYSPGTLFPGIIGGISLILAFYSMHALPVNYAGLALIIFSIILFILEVKITSYGLLSIGGIIALFLGSMMLIKPDSGLELAGISKAVIIPVVVVTSLFFLFLATMGLRAQRSRPVTGVEGFNGQIGKTMDVLNPTGDILVFGEIWRAESVSGPIEKEMRVRVTGRKGFTLYVEAVND